MNPVATYASAASDAPRQGARLALGLLLAINLFNYIDRYILAATEQQIRAHFGLSKVQSGALWTVFLLSYMALSPVFGWLGDRRSRWSLVGIGVILWSLASGGSGLALTFGMLLATRCLVGVGEAAYGPLAPTVISDLYPVARRGRVLAWFYMAIPVGAALGYALGALAGGKLGWRWPFFLVVAPGLLLGAMCFLMLEPQRGQTDLRQPGAVRSLGWRDYLILLRTPSYVLDTLGMTVLTFAIGGISYWMPTYLKERKVTGPIDPTVFFGILVTLAGISATLLGGLAGDRLRQRYPGSYFLVSGFGLALSLPCLLCVLYTPFPLAWGFAYLTLFWLFFNTGPSNTILANVTHPAMRSTAFAINIFIIHALGDAISPPIIGAIAERYHSLNAGFLAVSSVLAVGSVLWLWGARYLAHDTAAAPNRLPPA